MYTTNAQVTCGYVFGTPQFDQLLTAITANISYLSGKEFSFHRASHDDDALTLHFRSEQTGYEFTVEVGQNGGYFNLNAEYERFVEYYTMHEEATLRTLDLLLENEPQAPAEEEKSEETIAIVSFMLTDVRDYAYLEGVLRSGINHEDGRVENIVFDISQKGIKAFGTFATMFIGVVCINESDIDEIATRIIAECCEDESGHRPNVSTNRITIETYQST